MSSSNQGTNSEPKPSYGEWLAQNGYSDFDDMGKSAQPRAKSSVRRKPAQVVHAAAPGSTATPPNLSTLPYNEYLHTRHWWLVRHAALQRANHRCQLCNSMNHLQVHHRTYERRGAERDDDVIVLCDTCHTRFHMTAPVHSKPANLSYKSQTGGRHAAYRGRRTYGAYPKKRDSSLPAIIMCIVFALIIGTLAIVQHEKKKDNPAISNSSVAAPISRNACPAAFPIKGNLTTYDGEKIYHVPGGAYYTATNPEECFSTEEAARAHGYRRSKL